jgi:ribonuclease P protein subunit RPR2
MRKGRESRRQRPEWVEDVASERMKILLSRAKTHPERKKRYTDLARKIGMRYNVRMPKPYKRSFCKKCSGNEFRIRVFSKGKYVLYTCLSCGEKRRYPYSKQQKK